MFYVNGSSYLNNNEQSNADIFCNTDNL